MRASSFVCTKSVSRCWSHNSLIESVRLCGCWHACNENVFDGHDFTYLFLLFCLTNGVLCHSYFFILDRVTQSSPTRMLSCLVVFLFLQIVPSSLADHYKGGTITWKPIYPLSLTSPVQIVITARHSWTYSRYPCNETTIESLAPYNDNQNITVASLACISSAAACTSSSFQTVNLPFYCTDAYSPFGISTGSYTVRQNLTLNSVIDIAWRGASWSVETLTNAWSLVARIDLTPVSGRINSPPGTWTYHSFSRQDTELNILRFSNGFITNRPAESQPTISHTGARQWLGHAWYCSMSLVVPVAIGWMWQCLL